MLFVISLAITLLGLFASWGALKKRGLASGMRGAAWSTLPLALYLTGLTKFFTDLVFSPVKWAGVVLFGVGVVLYMTSGVMIRRKVDAPAAEPKSAPRGKAPKAAVEDRAPSVDPDLADIEQILKNRGIS